MRWFWGFLFLVMGIIYLGVNFDWWKGADLSLLINLWPVLLILLGLSIISRRWRWGWIVMVVALIGSFFLIFAPLMRVKYFENLKNGTKVQSEGIISETNILDATRGKVKIDAGALVLDISGRSDQMVSGDYKTNFYNFSTKSELSDSTWNYTITNQPNSGKFLFGNGKNELNLSFTDRIPLDFDLNCGASKLNLDLSTIIVGDVNISSGASDITLFYGERVEDRSETNINAGASKIEINLPTGIGAEVSFEGGMISKDLNGFKSEKNNKYQSENFNSAKKQIFIKIKAGASSVKVSY